MPPDHDLSQSPLIPAPKDDTVNPPAVVLVPFTCPWAQDGLAKALDGMVAVSDGAQGYGIGTRWVRRKSPADQLDSVNYWQKMVELYCGTAPLPTSVTGRDTANRVILRDV